MQIETKTTQLMATFLFTINHKRDTMLVMLKIKKSKKKSLIIIIVTLILSCSVGLIVWKKISESQRNKNTVDTANPINYDPPSEEIIKETEEYKKDLEQKTGTENSLAQPTNPATAGQASVVITSLIIEGGKVRASGIVSNIFEEGGACTLTLSKGTTRLTGTSQGFQDVNKTTCAPIYIDASSGEWAAVLSYSFQSTNGSSTPQTISVP